MKSHTRALGEDVAEAKVNNKWYKEFPKESSPCKHGKTELEVMELKSSGKKHLDAETAAYQLKESKSKDSELAWLKTALTKGTSSDKIAASIVLIQNNPKYNLSRLVSLVSQVKASKHSQSLMLITSLRDLFINDLLHPEYKLLKFEDQKLDELDFTKLDDNATKLTRETHRKKLLAHWYFEDQLHHEYERFITSLSTVASDTVDANREKAVAVMTDLLIANSEQEHKLLEFVINKIGDPRSRVASKAVLSISNLLFEHPNMKIVVLREIEKLLFRKNVAQRAQYYAICLLTQFVLERGDIDVSNSLIDVYFAFFKACLKRGEPDSRMMAAILTGVNRAYPFANLESSKLLEHIDSVYKVVHIGSFNVSLNALNLLHQVVGKEPEQENRFYTAFYRKLLEPQIGVANKRAVFLNLLYRVLRSDKSVTRLYAFMKRIFQVVLYFPASMACATLYVVSQVLQSRKDLQSIMQRGYKAIKQEEAVENKEESRVKTSEENLESEDDEEEKKNVEEHSILLSNVTIEPTTTNRETDVQGVVKLEDDQAVFYDPFCLNPLRSGAMRTPLAELEALSTHFHPSVALFASTLAQGRPIHYSGDPLEDLNLIRFLDRYVFKNPKKLDDKKVTNSRTPLAQRAKYVPRGVRSVAVDSEAYVNVHEDRIPVDELFLYRYLQRKNESRGWRIKDEDDDNDSVNSEEFNDLLDSLGGKKELDDLDIAADIGSSKKKKKKSEIPDSDDDTENDEESIGSDMSSDGNEEMDEEDMSDIDLEGIDDEDLSDMDFNDEDDSIDETESFKKSTKKVSKPKRKKIGKDENVFVAAEEFAEMLEEQGRAKHKHGSSNAFSDADGASAKQVDWEIDRHQRISGRKRPRSNNKQKGKQNVKKFKRKF
ncbi:CCAAT/enhancer-binding protein zeta [Venturia canescens]|uniref:CCAAT/enhancer-binding protein zeta n=1 Tax=Venturia canescens TaxID=32260 RepID=UPI001C9CE67D|nr:CCAAT/enhancer-binding protein zeta [Venturia canescens]